MKVRSFIGYPSYPDRDKSDWSAYNITMAVKGANFNGYADIKIYGKPYRIVSTNTQPIVDFFGSKICESIGSQPSGTAVFVLPSSSCTHFGNDPKAARIVHAIVNARCAIPVGVPFRWSEPMPKTAGGGGTRDANFLQGKLRLLPPPGISRAILVDDVMTSGGHLRAAARICLEHGIRPIEAICFARTVSSRPENILGEILDDLDV